MRLERYGRTQIVAVERRPCLLVGPAMILTSVVLSFGLAVTVLSDLPSLRLFGWLSAFDVGGAGRGFSDPAAEHRLLARKIAQGNVVASNIPSG